MNKIIDKITKTCSPLSGFIKKINILKNKSVFIITLMVLGTVAMIVPLVRDEIHNKTSTPLGASDQNAIIAIPQPPLETPFLVLSSERRQNSPQGSDNYVIFPHIPIDSTSFYFKEDSGQMIFETGVFCVDWEKADEKIRNAMISLQRDGDINIKKAFNLSCNKFKQEDNLDGLQVYSMNYPITGNLILSSYGNSLIFSRDREALIKAIIAIKYSMTRLSWNKSPCQASRTFIDSFKRYHFYLKTSEPGKIRELPYRCTQSLPIDNLKNMAISRIDPCGKTREIYTWLTKKEIDGGPDDEKDNICASTSVVDNCDSRI